MPTVDESGDSYMYFRLDLPETSKPCYGQTIEKDNIIIAGLRDQTAGCEWDDLRGRKYWCKLKLKCDCCSFKAEEEVKMVELKNGVLRMTMRIKRMNMGDKARVDCAPPDSLETSSSSKPSGRSRRR